MLCSADAERTRVVQWMCTSSAGQGGDDLFDLHLTFGIVRNDFQGSFQSLFTVTVKQHTSDPASCLEFMGLVHRKFCHTRF